MNNDNKKLPIRLGSFSATTEQKEIVNEIIDSGMITEGKYCRLFEEEWAKYIGVKHCIVCTNGTVGLILVLHSLKLLYDKSFKFAVPALTFPATLNAVLLSGHTSYLCDIGEDLQIVIDEKTIKENKIDAIIPVHLMGFPCDMENIMKLKEKFGLFVLEDACEANGSSFKNRKVGSFGNAGVFSFYMSHCIGIGELSVITTDSDLLAETIRSVKNHGRFGSNLEFNHKFIGMNGKTTEFMAGLAFAEMKNIDNIIKKRQSNVKYLNKRITNKKLILPEFTEQCSYLGYYIKADSKEYRDFLVKKLTEEGIETRKMFPCLANQKAYQFNLDVEEVRKKLPIAQMFEERAFYLPCHQYLTELELDEIIIVLNSN